MKFGLPQHCRRTNNIGSGREKAMVSFWNLCLFYHCFWSIWIVCPHKILTIPSWDQTQLRPQAKVCPHTILLLCKHYEAVAEGRWWWVFASFNFLPNWFFHDTQLLFQLNTYGHITGSATTLPTDWTLALHPHPLHANSSTQHGVCFECKFYFLHLLYHCCFFMRITFQLNTVVTTQDWPNLSPQTEVWPCTHITVTPTTIGCNWYFYGMGHLFFTFFTIVFSYISIVFSIKNIFSPNTTMANTQPTEWSLASPNIADVPTT